MNILKFNDKNIKSGVKGIVQNYINEINDSIVITEQRLKKEYLMSDENIFKMLNLQKVLYLLESNALKHYSY